MARTVRTKVYKFDELNDEAKQVAIEQYRNGNTEILWADENRSSMEKFSEIFPIKVTDWSYGGSGEGVSFYFTHRTDDIEELSGQRLATYIWNNYKSEIYSYKYYSKGSYTYVNPNDANDYKYRNVSRHSKIQIEKYDCPLTGYTMDNELLDEIWKFLDKPDSRNFKELLDDCFNSWVKACNADIEDQNSDEYIAEHLEANGYEFTANGRRF